MSSHNTDPTITAEKRERVVGLFLVSRFLRYLAQSTATDNSGGGSTVNIPVKLGLQGRREKEKKKKRKKKREVEENRIE